jgi:hypothetical protein
MNGMRFAMHGDESYDRMEQNMIDQIELWERPPMTDQEVLANWKVKVKELEGAFKRARRKK